MPSTHSLFKRLQVDFPEFRFLDATGFWWSPSDQIIHLDTSAEYTEHYSLHELSHALLGHQDYRYDIDLIKLERDAWDYAKNTLAPRYDMNLQDHVIQDNLDTYREWLHARSTCPDCEATGLQTRQQHYRCLDCGHTWRVNEARLCALRRYSLQTK